MSAKDIAFQYECPHGRVLHAHCQTCHNELAEHLSYSEMLVGGPTDLSEVDAKELEEAVDGLVEFFTTVPGGMIRKLVIVEAYQQLVKGMMERLDE